MRPGTLKRVAAAVVASLLIAPLGVAIEGAVVARPLAGAASTTGNTWTTIAVTPGSVDHGALAFDSANSKLYALRGTTTAAWSYTPGTNTWAAIAPTPATVKGGARSPSTP